MASEPRLAGPLRYHFSGVAGAGMNPLAGRAVTALIRSVDLALSLT